MWAMESIMSDTDDRAKPWAIIIAAIITAILGPIVVWWYISNQSASQPAAELAPQGTPSLQVAQPTNTVQPTNTPMVSIPRSHWPASPQEAANYFAKGKGSWEINEYGGWHLIPQWPPIEVTVPLGVTMEGYNDGPNPPETRRCMTVLGPAQVVIQGGTFWFPDNPDNPPATARKIYREQTAWTIAQGGPAKCEAFGFQP